MKLQFNLLPDVKQEYLKTQKTKRTVIAASVAASALCLFIFMFMIITVYVINDKQLSDADKNIDKYSKQLKAIDGLDKILTIQNQLKSVSTLHQDKHITSRLYQYLPEVTPNNICLSQVNLATTNSTLTLNGTTDTLKSINIYIDTLKFTMYKQGGSDSGKNAFPTVVESSFGLSSGQKGSNCAGQPANATFEIAIHYDPALFSNANSIDLKIPAGITTRSVVDDPSNPLFNGQAKVSGGSSSGNAQTNGGAQ